MYGYEGGIQWGYGLNEVEWQVAGKDATKIAEEKMHESANQNKDGKEVKAKDCNMYEDG